MTNNIDTDLKQILSNVKDNSVTNILNESQPFSKSKIKSTCTIAMTFQTKKNAWDAMTLKNRDVYILNINKNGKIQQKCFARCTRTCQNGSKLCWRHNQAKNKDNLRYWEDIIKSDLAEQASAKSPFFNKKGKKFTTPNESIPIEISRILNNSNLKDKLINYANELFESYKKPKLLISLEDEKIEDNSSDVNESESDLEEENEESDNESLSNKNKNSGVSSSEEEEESESDLEEISCIEIKTKNGRTLFLNTEEDNKIFDLEEGEGKELGFLIEVDYQKAPIFYEDKNYICAIKYSYLNDEYLKCELTNKVFSKEEPHQYIGMIKLKKGKEKLYKKKSK